MSEARSISENVQQCSCPACEVAAARQIFVKDSFPIFKCDVCAFVFVHPFPDDATLASYYRDNYRSASLTYYPKARSRRWRAFWRSLKFIKYLRGKDVVDLGCGGGFMVEAFSRLGAHAYGLDLSENSIAYARQAFPNSPFYCETFRDFTQRNLQFDFVFSSELLEHLPGPRQFMMMLEKITRPGGFVYISAPDIGHRNVPLDLLSWSDICPPEHLQWFSTVNLIALFEKHGFKLHRNFGNKKPAHSILFVKL